MLHLILFFFNPVMLGFKNIINLNFLVLSYIFLKLNQIWHFFSMVIIKKTYASNLMHFLEKWLIFFLKNLALGSKSVKLFIRLTFYIRLWQICYIHNLKYKINTVFIQGQQSHSRFFLVFHKNKSVLIVFTFLWVYMTQKKIYFLFNFIVK